MAKLPGCFACCTLLLAAGEVFASPRAYVTNSGDGTVSVIDTASKSVAASVPLAGDPEGLSLTPDGKHLYVATWPNSVTVIDTETGAVTTTVPVGNLPVAFGQFVGADVPDPTPTPNPCEAVCDGRPCSVAGVGGNCLWTGTGCVCVPEVTPVPTRTLTTTPTFRFGDGPTPTTLPVPSACVGDCNGDLRVDISEIVAGVNVALETADVAACLAFDADRNGAVAVNELVQAVHSAVDGCPGLPGLLARPAEH